MTDDSDPAARDESNIDGGVEGGGAFSGEGAPPAPGSLQDGDD